MGKNGKALRMAKKQLKTYTFTAEQLENHDRQVREAYQESCILKLQDKFAEKHDVLRDNFICLVMNCCLTVLVRDMGFKPFRNSRSRISRFASAVVTEVNRVLSNEITEYKYMLQTDELCSMKFEADNYEQEE